MFRLAFFTRLKNNSFAAGRRRILKKQKKHTYTCIKRKPIMTMWYFIATKCLGLRKLQAWFMTGDPPRVHWQNYWVVLTSNYYLGIYAITQHCKWRRGLPASVTKKCIHLFHYGFPMGLKYQSQYTKAQHIWAPSNKHCSQSWCFKICNLST